MKKILLYILFSFAFFSNAQTLVKGPYLTVATNHSINIQWFTDFPSIGVVTYGLTPNSLSNSVSNSTLQTQHIITISNLQPNTKYYYSVGTNLAMLQSGPENYFITAPTAAANYDKPIRFWTMGDMGKQTQQQIDVKNAFLNYIDTNHVNGWIMLGDNAYETGSDLDYQNGFFGYYQNDILKNTVLWPCLGNHDYANLYALRTNYQIPYFDLFSLPANGEAGGLPSFNERYYSYNYGNVHFINLDSYGLELYNGTYYGLADTLFSAQANWLKADLAANHLPWTIVCYHHPAYCMGTHNSDAESDLVAIRTNLNPILERFNVDLVLNGHSHSYERSHFMKNHFGLETTFDSTIHEVQTSTGFYDGTSNSCAYIKNTIHPTSKDSGTVYAVVGSGSAIPVTPFAAWPHNAMVTSSMENGSMVLTIEGNRLDAEWISIDTAHPVKDRFTIFKNVNTIDTLFMHYPDTLTLSANWKANKYAWSTLDSTQTISVIVSNDTTFIVQDEQFCFNKTFVIKEGNPLSTSNLLAKNELKIYPNPVQNYFTIQVPENGNYEIQLYNTLGEIVKKESLVALNNQIQYYISNENSTGNYFLVIRNDKNHSYKARFSKY